MTSLYGEASPAPSAISAVAVKRAPFPGVTGNSLSHQAHARFDGRDISSRPSTARPVALSGESFALSNAHSPAHAPSASPAAITIIFVFMFSLPPNIFGIA